MHVRELAEKDWGLIGVFVQARKELQMSHLAKSGRLSYGLEDMLCGPLMSRRAKVTTLKD